MLAALAAQVPVGLAVDAVGQGEEREQAGAAEAVLQLHQHGLTLGGDNEVQAQGAGKRGERALRRWRSRRGA